MDMWFSVICIIWFLSEILLNRLARAGVEDRQGADGNSLRLIWMTIVLSVVAASVIAQRYPFPLSGNAFVKETGLGILLAGIGLRLLVVRAMGRLFTVNVTIRSGHTLKTDGFFRLVRHPSYMFSLLSFIGFGIALNNWISLAVVVIPVFWSFTRRITVEEKVLTEQFGEAYTAYQKRTKRLIPFVY